MEDLSAALLINQVPGRNPFHQCSWEKLAWPSQKSLSGWFSNLIDRVSMLAVWSSDFTTPVSLWIPALFNPAAFLTAVKQVTARRLLKPLDKMTIETHVTTVSTPDEVNEYPEDGAL